MISLLLALDSLQRPAAVDLAYAAVAKPMLLQEAPYRPSKGETDLVGTVGNNKGAFIIKLYTKDAPRTTLHIISLVKTGFYDRQRFFRVINSPKPYLVQFGDPNSKTLPMNSPRLGQSGSGIGVTYEASGHSHEEGSVCLATVGDNRDTGDSQMYIMLGDYSTLLDGKDTVFGKIVHGMDVIKKIEVGDTILQLRVVQP